MPEEYLHRRLEYLRASQNDDGGWGYVPGKQSWMEPTAYAMLALHGQSGSEEALGHAWETLSSWQLADGGWQPARNVGQAGWATALAVTLHTVRDVYGDSFVRAVDWLLETRGAEGSWLKRLVYLIQPKTFLTDPRVQGWPWLPGTGSWVEPTSHALIALRRAREPLERNGYSRMRELRARVRLAEQMMQQRRATDGGWNYGNRVVLGEELPSYPETTGLALLGMAGCEEFDAASAIRVAKRQHEETRSQLARAWLAIALRNHGVEPPAMNEHADGIPRHVYLTALEALAAPEGNHALLAAEGAG